MKIDDVELARRAEADFAHAALTADIAPVVTAGSLGRIGLHQELSRIEDRFGVPRSRHLAPTAATSVHRRFVDSTSSSRMARQCRADYLLQDGTGLFPCLVSNNDAKGEEIRCASKATGRAHLCRKAQRQHACLPATLKAAQTNRRRSESVIAGMG